MTGTVTGVKLRTPWGIETDIGTALVHSEYRAGVHENEQMVRDAFDPKDWAILSKKFRIRKDQRYRDLDFLNPDFTSRIMGLPEAEEGDISGMWLRECGITGLAIRYLGFTDFYFTEEIRFLSINPQTKTAVIAWIDDQDNTILIQYPYNALKNVVYSKEE